MRLDIITLFPEMFAPIYTSIPARAQKRGLVEVGLVDLRAYGSGRHFQTDDIPYGGGSGMVMQPEPLGCAIEDAQKHGAPAHVIYLSPQGSPLNQKRVEDLAHNQQHLILICGHYEGIDERILQKYVHEEISLGDFVISGGELAAMVLADAVIRLLPGVIDSDSASNESFTTGILDYPYYTRPLEYKGLQVPEVLVHGDHKKIAEWRRRQALLNTARKRPDLLAKQNLSDAEREFLHQAGYPQD
ncbi:MAG: tRNA (guanosine(37)-N1)-methyltransferase TrmD [bacterium]|nr:tRNA (guanosine(37)-N1)-methyltransferase TrmD [bacterium]